MDQNRWIKNELVRWIRGRFADIGPNIKGIIGVWFEIFDPVAGNDGHVLVFLVVAGRPAARVLARGQRHEVDGVGFDVVDGHVAGRIPRQHDGRRSQGHRFEVGRRFWSGAFRDVYEEPGRD